MVVVKYDVTHLNQLKISKTAILPKHWDSSNHVVVSQNPGTRMVPKIAG
jgi:hypothetical protein